MGQRLGRWQCEADERLWLALLIDAMEEDSRPEIRALPVESSILNAVRAQLARPVPSDGYVPSAFSLRN